MLEGFSGWGYFKGKMSYSLQILFIEDEPGQHQTLLDAFKDKNIEISFQSVGTPSELGLALENNKWDFIFSKNLTGQFIEKSPHDIVKSEAPTTPFFWMNDAAYENRLSESEQNYRIMVESVRDYAIFMLNPQGIISTWNPGARRIFGYLESEAVGQSGEILFSDEDLRLKVWPQQMLKARNEGRAEDDRWQIRKNKARFWSSGVLTALYNKDGSLRGYTKIMRDNTDRKLALEQVEDARRKAESASQAKTQFLTNISHEIRTPLGIMLGFAELLAEANHTNEEREAYVQSILRNGQQLSRVINDVLDVSKVESNKLETEKTQFSLPEFMSDLLATLRSQAEEKGLEMIVTSEGPVPDRVFSDEVRLRQILLSLIGNAIKFTDMGLIELKVRTVSSPQTHSSMILEFEVKDTGRGIPQEDVQKLFQPFTQGDNSTKRQFGGTGLGLYLSKRLSQALGGDLILKDTDENQGSTFVFTIDAGPFQTDVKFYTERSATGVSSKFEKSLKGLRILVVDDSPDNRLLVRRILEHAQAEIEEAENGLAGVEMAARRPFDLILMDIQMPIMDGYEAYRQLRASSFQKPIVALTAHALHSEREKCFSLGFDDHLSKPIDRKVLVESIARLCARETAKVNVIPLRLDH